MSSVGQAVGGVVGAVVGFFTPLGPLYGAQLGMMVGGYLDPPKGPHSYGPRLDDLSVQTSTYGAFIPRVYGHAPIVGNIIWLENNKLREVSETESQGGKGGGGGSEVTTYSYYATFAVGLCHGQISDIRRIWIGNKLFYDAGSSDEGTVRQGGENAKYFTVYNGSETQQPDDRMEATLGVGNVPAYRGLAYIVFKDLPLKDYGNSLMAAQVKVEVCHAVDPVSFALSSHSNDWSVPYYGSNTGYNFRALQNPCDSRGLQNIFQRVSFTDYAVQHVNRSGKSTWYHDGLWTGSTTLYGFNGRANINDASFAYIDMASSPPWVGHLSNKKLIRFQCPEITGALYAKAQFAESGGVAWVRLDDKMWNATSGVIDIGTSSLTSAYVRSGNLFLAGIPAMPEGSLSSTLNYSEHDDTGAIVRSGSIPFTQTSAAARRIGLDDGTANAVGGCVDDRYFYFSYLSDQNIGSGDCAVVCLVFDLIENAFVREVNIPYTMGAGTPDFRLTSSAHLQCSVHGRVVYAQWEEGDDYSKVHYLSFAPLQLNASSTTLGATVSSEVLRSNLLTESDIDVTSLIDSVRGYRVTGNGSIRSAIEPLAAAFPFDVIQSGYKVKFVRRGGTSSVATIPASDLDARAMDSVSGVSISDIREMDTQLPCRVVVNYLDELRDYDTGSQYAARINTDAVNVEQLDLPIVMTADEAAQAAEVLLYMRWLDRNTINNLRLPPTYNALEPLDVVTVNTETRSYTLRLAPITYLPDGRLECQAKPHLNTTYTSSAKGQTGNLPGSVIPFRGPSYYTLIDCACLKDAMNTPGFLTAMGGLYDSWAGGTIIRSTDVGATWHPVMSFSVESTTGICAAPLAAAVSDAIDAKGTLSVVMQSGTLSSVTRDQMLNGANHFAYGAPGRWEIIAAQNCILQSDGSYILRDLLRGRFGTEHHSGAHVDGDMLIVLSETGTPFFPVAASTIGAAYLYKGVTAGATIDSDSAAEFAYVGENLKPLSPVYVNGARDPNGFWWINWMRRTRYDGEWRDLVDAALGEASEQYVIEIYSSSAFATVKRTITVTTNAVQYTAAQQIEDFGSIQSVVYCKVCQVSQTAGRGAGKSATLSSVVALIDNNPHKFWRIYITGFGDSGFLQIQEVEMHESLGGVDVTSPSSAVISDGSYYSTYAPSRAFDGITDNESTGSYASALSGSTPRWIGVNFGTGNEKNIAELKIWPAYGLDSYTRWPTAFALQFSDDGSAWTTKKSWSGLTSGWSSGTGRIFN